jgi:hypothetical protein
MTVLAALFPRGRTVLNAVGEGLVAAIKAVKPAPRRAELTVGEHLAQDHPVIAEPAPGTPAAALKSAIDTRLAEALLAGVGAAVVSVPGTGVPRPPRAMSAPKTELKRALAEPLSDPVRQEYRRLVLKAAYELQEEKARETDRGRMGERADVRVSLLALAAKLASGG